MYISNKAQIWELDLIIALVLFVAAALLFYNYSSDLATLQEDKINMLSEDAKIISNHLVSAGYPLNWQSDINNTIFIGLTDGNKRITPDKVTAAASIDYNNLRQILGTQNDFYIYFEYKNNSIFIDGIDDIGKPGVTKSNIKQVEDPEDLIKIERLLFYDSKIITMGVYVW